MQKLEYLELGADGLEDIMSLVERMIRYIVVQVHGDIVKELTTTIKGQDNTVSVDEIPGRWESMTSENWTRMRYDEAVKILIDRHASGPFNIPPKVGSPLQSSHEQYLASRSSTPIFITHYPSQIKPFYMLKSPGDTTTVANFDLLVPSMGEIAGGSLRIHELAELEASMRYKEMDEEELEWYKDLRRWGTIPHGGFGLGFDRLIGYLAGTTNLREVVAFPRMFGKSGCRN